MSQNQSSSPVRSPLSFVSHCLILLALLTPPEWPDDAVPLQYGPTWSVHDDAGLQFPGRQSEVVRDQRQPCTQSVVAHVSLPGVVPPCQTALSGLCPGRRVLVRRDLHESDRWVPVPGQFAETDWLAPRSRRTREPAPPCQPAPPHPRQSQTDGWTWQSWQQTGCWPTCRQSLTENNGSKVHLSHWCLDNYKPFQKQILCCIWQWNSFTAHIN